jgi:cytochrome c biogenesis protein CcdA
MSEQPSYFAELKQLIIEYFESKLKLLKIDSYEKIAKISAVFISSILIGIVILFMFFFLNIAGGFFFGELLHSNAYGFLAMFGIYFIVFLLLFLFRKNLLEKFIINKIIQKLFKKERND